MTVSIKTVAEAAGVSITTVSFVMNNRQPHVSAISEETQERVRECARALGYRRNEAAATLRTGRSHWIGVFVQQMRRIEEYQSAPHELALLWGVQNGLAQQDYYAVLGSRSGTGDTDSLDAVIYSGIGGLVFKGPTQDELYKLEEMAATGTPSVVIFPRTRADFYPHTIDMDNYKAGELVASLFLEAGRKAPMCVTSEQEYQPRQARWEAFSDVITRELGSAPALCVIDELAGNDIKTDMILNAIRSNKPDAVMASYSDAAIFVNAAVEKLGLAVPEDLAIIGFDCHSLFSTQTHISGVGTSWWTAGRIAAESIIDMIVNKTRWTVPKKLEPVFIAGDSTPPELAEHGVKNWFA